MRGHAIAVCLLHLVGRGSTAALAQHPDTLKQPASDWVVGASVGMPGFGVRPVPQLLTLGLHVTQLRPRRIGGDFSIGTMPRALVDGVLPVGVRAGLVLPFALAPNVLLVPSAGVSVVGIMANNGGGVAPGLNAGVAAMMFGASSVGIRTGVTLHEFGLAGPLWLFEVGVVSKPRAVR